MKPQYLGEFEYAVLLAILQTNDAYAVPIRAVLEERTGRPVARGALYTALDRLETKGCLRSRMGDPTGDRGGKPRRYFALTPAGLRALKATHGAFANLARGLEAILGRSVEPVSYTAGPALRWRGTLVPRTP